MPSSPRSTLILVRRSTRARLEAAKGDGTFDAVVSRLLDAAPAWAVRQPRPMRATRVPLPPAERRTPAKQVLLARLARSAWKARLQSGELIEEGPRLFTWTPKTSDQEVPAIEWPKRRGFTP